MYEKRRGNSPFLFYPAFGELDVRDVFVVFLSYISFGLPWPYSTGSEQSLGKILSRKPQKQKKTEREVTEDFRDSC